MNIVLVEPHEYRADGTVVLEGRRADHLREVLHKGVGDSVAVGEVGGKLGRAEILQAHPARFVLRCELEREPPPKLRLRLVLALPRPPVLRRVLSHAAALGVEAITLLHTARVEKSYWQSPALTGAKVREQLLLGLEQSVDTKLPGVSLARRFRPFVEDELPVLGAGARILAAHPGGVRCPTDVDLPCVVLVGPEGGFVDFELELLHNAGAERVGLGPRILRVETAVTALVGRLCLGVA